ncbi:MAG: hypothetical protein ACRELD_12570, partial [Longimicrobiales bacterium]
MIAWMLYALLVGALVTAAAWSAETALRAAGRPVRSAWIVAAIATSLLPALALLGVASPLSVPVLPPLIVGGAPLAAPAALALSEVDAGGAASWAEVVT